MSLPLRRSLRLRQAEARPDAVRGWGRPRGRTVAVIATIGGALLAWLVFGLFEVQALFLDEVVSEPPPVPATSEPETEGAAVPPAPASGAEPAPTPSPAAEHGPADLARSGSFSSRAHTTTGTATVLTAADGQRFLRLQGFRTDNGPDVHVYLSSAPADADGARFDDDFVDLGALKGNVGDQNYAIPPDVDLARYSSVAIWCVRFSVVFGVAAI